HSIISEIAQQSTANLNVTTTTAETLVLSNELQKVRDSLPEETAILYNNRIAQEDKESFLKAIAKAQQDERKKGESTINLIVNLAVLLIVIGFIVGNAVSKQDIYEIISYSIIYSVQYFAILMVLYREKVLVGMGVLFSDWISKNT
ncbi:6411_t:CDS:2, partial [Racocetra persica]